MAGAEFDKFATSYREVHRQNIAISGEDPEYFARYKMQDLAWHLRRLGIPETGAFLDFGCGPGNSIAPFREILPAASLTCADVSTESLAVAREQHGPAVNYIDLGDPQLRRDGHFDGAFANCVFHHIPPKEHGAALESLAGFLRPGGMLMIYEHNPWNPVTVRAVRTCPLDENAVLIAARTMAARVRAAGFARVRIDFRVFFPSGLAALRPLESWLRWLPLGAQYSITAVRP